MPTTDVEYKDDYDPLLQFSRITGENWLLPDRKDYVPFGISEQQWVAQFLRPRLDVAVPTAVVQAFEIVRGCMIYSWFFYPLATLGFEQCTRVVELAARERCCMLQCESEDFAQNLRMLIKAGLISADDEPRWQALRRLRNNRSHLDGYMLTDPGQALGFLTTAVELVNVLFASPSTA